MFLSVLQCVAVCCSVLQCAAVCVAVCCRVLQSVLSLGGEKERCSQGALCSWHVYISFQIGQALIHLLISLLEVLQHELRPAYRPDARQLVRFSKGHSTAAAVCVCVCVYVCVCVSDGREPYGVAMVSRLLQNIFRFCRISSFL